MKVLVWKAIINKYNLRHPLMCTCNSLNIKTKELIAKNSFELIMSNKRVNIIKLTKNFEMLYAFLQFVN